jgi:shikimate kinase/3-dehydroquinate synthase
MDLVLVGLPGSGKSVVGKRIAQRHGATLIDLDELIERDSRRTIPEIFAAEGEPGFRARELAMVRSIGPADRDRRLRRVIATGGGTPVDPRNRWLLYRGRVPVWLDSRPEALAQRLRRSRNVRPLIAGRDPVAALRDLSSGRERFYSAATRLNGMAEVRAIVDTIEELVANGPGDATTLLQAETRVGRIGIGDGNAGEALLAALRRFDARRAIVLTEPMAWSVAGRAIESALIAAGLPVSTVLLPRGEAAKRLTVVEAASRELALLRAERGEPLIAVGGGALGDTVGVVAATWLRGVPLIHVPTTLVAQIDSSIGGKTAVDLPEGKNLVGAYHQPSDVIIDIRLLAALPPRERRAALGEAAKMAVLGDDRLFEILEADGVAIAEAEPSAFDSGAVAELVERCAWAKVEIVCEDEREQGARITLNLGHSVGHALEAAAGYRDILHGEAVAFGLRAAARIGVAMGVTPPARAERIESVLTNLGLGAGRLPYPRATVKAALGMDKKHAGGRLRWILPTESGVTTRSDVPVDVADAVIGEILAPAAAPVPDGLATAP